MIKDVQYSQLRADAEIKACTRPGGCEPSDLARYPPSLHFMFTPNSFIRLPNHHPYEWKLCVCSYLDQSECLKWKAFDKLGGIIKVGGPHLAVYDARRKQLHLF